MLIMPGRIARLAGQKTGFFHIFSLPCNKYADALDAEGIETRPIWKPMHLQPVFEKYDFIQVEDEMSVSEDIFNRGLCLPSDIKNTEADMERIIRIVRKQFR